MFAPLQDLDEFGRVVLRQQVSWQSQQVTQHLYLAILCNAYAKLFHTLWKGYICLLGRPELLTQDVVKGIWHN